MQQQLPAQPPSNWMGYAPQVAPPVGVPTYGAAPSAYPQQPNPALMQQLNPPPMGQPMSNQMPPGVPLLSCLPATYADAACSAVPCLLALAIECTRGS
eukprot:6933656-Pyramimonas_sp.AAC.1